MKQALSDQEILAAQAGVDLATAGGENQDAGAASSEDAGGAASSASTEVTESEKKNEGEVVAFLRGELREAQASAVMAQANLEQANKKLAASDAVIKSMSGIVAKSVSQMKVGLGCAAMDYSSMTPEALLAEHKATSETFLTKFRSGGVAAVTPKDTQAAAATELPSDWSARVQATRVN